MSDLHPSNLSWLDRLTARVPGYSGYESHDHRRSAALALRDALTRRLSALKRQLEGAVADCRRREALRELPALERIEAHVDRVVERVQRVGAGVDSFYGAPDLHADRVDPVYAIDHAALDTAERLVHHFDPTNPSHDRLAAIEAGLKALEHTLDERAMLMRAVGPEQA